MKEESSSVGLLKVLLRMYAVNIKLRTLSGEPKREVATDLDQDTPA